MVIFAKSEKDAELGFRTQADKSIVKSDIRCANRPSEGGGSLCIKLY